jgi:hypothetical protein
MRDQNDNHNEGREPREEIELTPQEKKAYETLPRDKMPAAELEDRVVAAIERRGVFEAPRGRVVVFNARRIAAVVAAAVALVAAGFATGQWAGMRRAATAELTASAEFAPPELSDLSVAATLQRTGSEYVTALERFAELPDSVDGDLAVQGREVALATLYSAADQVTRLVPSDELTRQLIAAINIRQQARLADGTRVIEF